MPPAPARDLRRSADPLPAAGDASFTGTAAPAAAAAGTAAAAAGATGNAAAGATGAAALATLPAVAGLLPPWL